MRVAICSEIPGFLYIERLQFCEPRKNSYRENKTAFNFVLWAITVKSRKDHRKKLLLCTHARIICRRYSNWFTTTTATTSVRFLFKFCSPTASCTIQSNGCSRALRSTTTPFSANTTCASASAYTNTAFGKTQFTVKGKRSNSKLTAFISSIRFLASSRSFDCFCNI